MRSLLFLIPLLASFHTSLSNNGNYEKLKVPERYDEPEMIFKKTCCGLIDRPSEGSKHEGYRFTAGMGWHKYHNQSATWAGAVRTCFMEGAHLAVIDTWKEAELLGTMMNDSLKANNASQTKVEKALIGLHDFYETRELVTVLGQPFKKIELLLHPQKNYGNSNCVAFASNNKLHYVRCNSEFPFFCEIPTCRLREPGTC